VRDLIVLSLVAVGALSALRHPWLGAMLWTWVSIMNPHRMAWGIAFDAPVAQVAAIATLIGMLVTKDLRQSPFKGAPVAILAIFCVWMTLSWALGLDPADDYAQWNKVMKVYFMIFIALAVLHSKKHVLWLAAVCAGSIGLLGIKTGVFTLLSGGNDRVWGPPGTFIADNNEFGLALIVSIPLMRFLQMQLQAFWARQLLTVTMLLCALGALGTQSRGALLAISAMSVLLWWRGKSRLLGGLAIGVAALLLLGFMPESWSERMQTIGSYEEDGSAMGRISAWWNAWNLAFHYPTGIGFNAARAELFGRYSPYPDLIQAAHSIYFQILGNHGFIGLAIFAALWIATWRQAGWLRVHAAQVPQARWCADLGAMCQVSLAGYAVGGAFLSLAYWDLPYDILTMVVVARVWVRSRAWEREAAAAPAPAARATASALR
jgi:probable O-glycosylation ligase (exosortase A-associated)